jgi:hypothetical protein
MSLAGSPYCWPGGARRAGGASPVCGLCAEHGKARADTAPARRRDARGSAPSRRNGEVLSTVAARAAGPALRAEVAGRAHRHARWQEGGTGPRNPARVGGFTRARQPVHALRVRQVAGTRVPRRGIRTLRQRRRGALRDGAAGPQGPSCPGGKDGRSRAATAPGQDQDRVLPGQEQASATRSAPGRPRPGTGRACSAPSCPQSARTPSSA